MHEHGLLDRLLALALEQAAKQGGTLRGVHVRLGAMYPAPERFSQEFSHVCEHLGRSVSLRVELDPLRPTGLELVAIDVAEEKAP